MTIHLSVPARINLLGNPGDANEGAYATISAAVNLHAHATIEFNEKYILDIADENHLPTEFKPSKLPLPYQGRTDLINASLNWLFNESPEFHTRIYERGFFLRMSSEVPRQSGLGGSSLFVLLTLAAMREYYQLDHRVHNDYVLAEMAQRIEEVELGITCGFADRYVPLFGGLAYIDYHGKLEHKPIGEEPLATYERLDQHIGSLPLMGMVTGVQHDSGDVHSRMRPRFLQEYSHWQKTGGEMPPMVSYMHAAWECAWRGKMALLEGNLPLLGNLMDENHLLVDKMMQYCGFNDGAGWANNLFIQAAHDHGVLGAKLTGAGGGGSVFAMVNPGEESRLARAWQEAARVYQLHEARVLELSLSAEGLVIEQQ